MTDIQHEDIQHADCHEPKWLGIAVAADAGKVVTASSTDGLSEFRKLTFAELTAGDVKATFFTLVDPTDGTKKAVFLLSGITTATTRTYTMPNATGTVILQADTATLTNKRVTPRTTLVTYAASITPASDTADVYGCDSLTGNITINAPSGTPTDGQVLVVRLTQDGTGGRTMTWNAAFITTGADTTTASTTTTRVFRRHSARAKWIQEAYTTGI